MKKIFIGMVAFFVLLSFMGCKTEVKEEPLSTSELVLVFYTAQNPVSVASIQNLTPITTLEAEKSYYLFCMFHQPDYNVVKLRMEYDGGHYRDYLIDSSTEWVGLYWDNEYWTLSSGTDDVECRFYLIDNLGRKSNTEIVNITVVAN
jgi:hypothetical protein